MADMILRTSLTSPFGRKPRLAAAVLGLADRIEVVPADFLDDTDSLRTENPLGKIPTLVLADGATLYDSRVILEYFDYLAGGNRIIPVEPVARFAALKLQAIGDGILDAGVLRRLETMFRDEPLYSDRWLAHQCGKMNRALDVLEEEPPSEVDILVGEIAVACGLGFIDFRLGDDWRASRPRLAGWFARFGERCPGFAETVPH
ncbi:glutathione S-transferase family protein [Pleomorphomonas oryzae]|uniref:glutathione S-transferase family protein n=1 Tax=Pleomorphomonas oryzae TaxID=261934 RepID=UPI00040722CE|nr:glutathione S-transferase family protein [Pleomorphomonas oryzae]